MLLVLASLLICPAFEVVFPPPTRPGTRLSLAIHFDVLRFGVRTEAHTAAQMALCEAVLIPVVRRDRRVRPLQAVLVVVARFFTGLPRVFSPRGAVLIWLIILCEQDVPSVVGGFG